ncbi:BglG family transcription antiterminator [Erysipelothrix sp. HDW6C]|uniref:BglG family transcription antiterminator n=1 Tax=Erysipelothrix sp. HDW6C TaxID=2714930 RepID=UPI00140E1834|nr:BglG family transcription antiterminator [Erysipelothrix sp. HDW6C]QIK70075.1 BglG family transcription antiterminator [Erysipelothrix sp. HDW6C]
MKNFRIHQILTTLIESDAFIKTKDIARQLDVSSRTIFNDIDSRQMERTLHGATIERRPNVGLRLIATPEQKRKISYEIFNHTHTMSHRIETDDIAIIIDELLRNHKPVSIDDLSQRVYRSNITALLDATQVYVEKHHCKLVRKPYRGITIEGNESDKRSVLRSLLLQNLRYDDVSANQNGRVPYSFMQLLVQTYSQQWIDSLLHIIERSETNMGLKYTDYDVAVLLTKLAILVERSVGKHAIQEKTLINEKPQEYYIAMMIKDSISDSFYLELTSGEIYEIMNYLMVTRKKENSDLVIHNQISLEVVDKFIKLVGTYLNFDLHHDSELANNLLNHLRPAIRRIKFGVSSENPLLDRIKFEYTHVYIAVMTSIEFIENTEHVVFDANEIGYICLHIAAALNRGTQSRYVRGILICDDGLSIEGYVKSKIEQKFTEIDVQSTIQYSSYNHDFIEGFDLIINATNRAIIGDKVVNISVALTREDITAINAALFTFELRRTMLIKDTLKNHIYIFNESLTDRDAILKKYSGYLEIDNYVSSHFFESMMLREKSSPTAMGRGVAVPHGSRSHVYSSIVLVIKLEKEIIWNDQLVDIIFLTAISTKTDDNYNLFFRKLFTIISDDDMINRIRITNDPNEIEAILLD